MINNSDLIIHKLTAENIYKLKYVELKLDDKGNLITIGGSNGQGKTSLLNAIRLAFGGKTEVGSKIVREGEKTGNVKIDCGEFVIERQIEGKEIITTITSKDGSKYKTPQTMLDKIKSNLSFKPDKFMTMKPKEQVEALKQLTGLDFSDLDSHRLYSYDERTILNRELNKLNDNYEEKFEKLSKVPKEEINISNILEKLKEADENNNKYNKIRTNIDTCKIELQNLKKQMEEIATKKQNLENNLEELNFIDTNKFHYEIQVAEELNKYIRERNELDNKYKKYNELKNQIDNFTKQIKDIDNAKIKQLSEVNLPIEGLSFNDNGVFFYDIPFDQLCHSEKLKISVAIGISVNPKLKLILIEDASLFDTDSFKIIAEMAKKNDYQILAEIVTRSEEDEKQCTIIIEDGEIKQ